MRSQFLKKFTSLFLIGMILSVSGLYLCTDTHAAEVSLTSSADLGCGAAADQCPACPVDDHSDADHDCASCYCACHLPLTEQPVRIGHAPAISQLVSPEQFTALPEVYLPKFIPPQNLA